MTDASMECTKVHTIQDRPKFEGKGRTLQNSLSQEEMPEGKSKKQDHSRSSPAEESASGPDTLTGHTFNRNLSKDTAHMQEGDIDAKQHSTRRRAYL